MTALDASTLEAQRRVVATFETRLVRRPGVVAAHVAGSLASGTADAWSDVDLVLVYATPETRAADWAARREIFLELGPTVTVADADDVTAWLQVGVLEGPILVDLSYRALTELDPGWWSVDMEILHDPGGALARLREVSRQRERRRPNAAELVNLTRKFWRWVTYTARDIVRGDAMEVLRDLQSIRENGLFPLAATIRGLPTDRIYRLERIGEPELVGLLRSTHPGTLERTGLETTLWKVVEVFVELRRRAQRPIPHDVDLDEARARAEVARLLAIPSTVDRRR